MSKVADRVSNTQDIVDSRDVIERIEELESDRYNYAPGSTDPDLSEDAQQAADIAAWAEKNPEDAAELKVLLALQEEAEGYAADWRHGEALIRDSYFETYAQELAEDIGAVNKAATWPNNCIDWAQAAEMLQQDYTSVDWDGVTYWIR